MLEVGESWETGVLLDKGRMALAHNVSFCLSHDTKAFCIQLGVNGFDRF